MFLGPQQKVKKTEICWRRKFSRKLKLPSIVKIFELEIVCFDARLSFVCEPDVKQSENSKLPNSRILTALVEHSASDSAPYCVSFSFMSSEDLLGQ